MLETRVNKYRQYRNSATKDGSVSFENTPETKFDNVLRCTTSTLPIDEVLKTIKDDEKEALIIKKQLRTKLMLKILTIIGCSLVVIGLVIFGIIVWR